MSAASDHYEREFSYWFERWKLYLVLMTDQIQIDHKEGRCAA